LASSSVACVQVNDLQTDWFKTPFGVKQGDNANLGIHLNDLTVGILLYADDIALLAESEDDLQNMLNLVQTWCCRWRLSINQSKQIIHFRKKGVPRSEKIFTFSDMPLENTSVYKYLGFPLDEFMNYENGIKLPADSAGRALVSVVNK
uniref:Reverse transcriptase domain-containing protein n=1 Tax=Dicentrarchus labrax TaxID=13489 RepID=A0A8P4KS21_DICLA